MQAFIRYEALSMLLDHEKDLTDDQIDAVIRMGLSDPDDQINEKVWNFLEQNNLVSKYKKELQDLAKKLNESADQYFQELSITISDKLLTPQ